MCKCCNSVSFKEIAHAMTDMSEYVINHLADTYDGDTDAAEFADGTPVPFCPMTRRQCMGRWCAAAVREECAGLAAATTGRVAEWRCAEYATVVDYDAADQPTPEEAEEVREDTTANVGHDLEGVADKLMDAIVALRRGEDATAKLYDAHMDLCSVIGDLLSMDPDESL